MGFISVGSPTTHDRAGCQILDQPPRAEAAALLVVREREMHRRLQLLAARFAEDRHHDGDKALHVRSAAAVEPAVLFDERERIARPNSISFRLESRLTVGTPTRLRIISTLAADGVLFMFSPKHPE